jgi:hypothetical protein
MGMCDASRCSGCAPEKMHRCATYRGPSYKSGGLLFIGLDHGKPEHSGESDWSEYQRREKVLEVRKTGVRWNGHYRGCVWVAADLLGFETCSIDCKERCQKRRHDLCVLTHFSQANAVKCVPRDSPDMAYRQDSAKVAACIKTCPLPEIEQLSPSVIIVQGRNTIRKPLENAINCSGWTWKPVCEHIACVRWKSGGHALVALLNHPSRGWLERNWEGEIKPILVEIRRARS